MIEKKHMRVRELRAAVVEANAEQEALAAAKETTESYILRLEQYAAGLAEKCAKLEAELAAAGISPQEASASPKKPRRTGRK